MILGKKIVLENSKKIMVKNQVFNGLNYVDQQIDNLEGKSKPSFVKMKFINLDIHPKFSDLFWYLKFTF